MTPPGERGPERPDSGDIEKIWDRLSREGKESMLGSWSKRAEELKRGLNEGGALTDEKLRRLNREMDLIWAELARLIEGGMEWLNKESVKADHPEGSRINQLNGQLKAKLAVWKQVQRERATDVAGMRTRIEECETAITLLREAIELGF